MPNLCIYAWLSRAGWLRHEQTQPAQYGVTAPKANSATQLQTVLSGCPASQNTSRRLLAPERQQSEFRLSEPDSDDVIFMFYNDFGDFLNNPPSFGSNSVFQKTSFFSVSDFP